MPAAMPKGPEQQMAEEDKKKCKREVAAEAKNKAEELYHVTEQDRVTSEMAKAKEIEAKKAAVQEEMAVVNKAQVQTFSYLCRIHARVLFWTHTYA